MTALLLGGAVFWRWYFGDGPLAFTSFDWDKEYRYLAIFQEALRSQRIPFHAHDPYHGVDRYLGLPETRMGPQLILLAFMDVQTFIVVETLLMYAVGGIGLFRLSNQLRLSFVSVVFVFSIFNFNGYLVSHIAVGHSMWTAYFLLPWLFLPLGVSRPSRSSVIQLGLVVFFMLLHGAFHMLVWCSLFLLFLAAADWRRAPTVLGGLALGFALGTCRLVPAALTFAGHETRFLSGYPDLSVLISALLESRASSEPAKNGLGWWEYDLYVGPIGAAFLVGLGLIPLLSGAPMRHVVLSRLGIPMGALALLALGQNYAPITRLGIPLFSAERVTTRFIIIPLFALMLLAAFQLNRMLTGRMSRLMSPPVLAAIGGMVWQLLRHAEGWRLPAMESASRRTADLSVRLIERGDAAYKSVVIGSWSFSALLSAALFAWWLRRRIVGLRPPSPAIS